MYATANLIASCHNKVLTYISKRVFLVLDMNIAIKRKAYYIFLFHAHEALCSDSGFWTYSTVSAKCHFPTKCVEAISFVNINFNRKLVICMRNYSNREGVLIENLVNR